MGLDFSRIERPASPGSPARPEVPRGMVRRGNPGTCVEAARAVAGRRSALHGKVLELLTRKGPMTAEELEEDAEVVAMGLAPSTFRKRVSELFQAGEVVPVGKRMNRRGSAEMTVWGLRTADGDRK